MKIAGLQFLISFNFKLCLWSKSLMIMGFLAIIIMILINKQHFDMVDEVYECNRATWASWKATSAARATNKYRNLKSCQFWLKFTMECNTHLTLIGLTLCHRHCLKTPAKLCFWLFWLGGRGSFWPHFLKTLSPKTIQKMNLHSQYICPLIA